MSKNKNVMIKTVASAPLMLCESVDSTPSHPRYRFSGIFTACSDENHTVINRNNRIYPATEMLRHLGYLREQVANNQLLGEIDHPDSRFETSLKEASHIIRDIYFDKSDCTVKGTIELLDTPMGKVAQELLINAKIPCSVSSRCSGTVDEKSRQVTIDSCFSYDIVLLGGFEEAVLQRVNENVSPKASQYLTESLAY